MKKKLGQKGFGKVVLNPKNRNRLFGVLALGSVPLTAVTAWAVSNSLGEFAGGVNIGSNYIYGTYPLTLMVGMGNVNAASALNTIVVGTGNVVLEDDSLIVGRYCASESGNAFTVGNGLGYGAPPGENYKNAFEVRFDGSVIVNEVQGDISMGIFE